MRPGGRYRRDRIRATSADDASTEASAWLVRTAAPVRGAPLDRPALIAMPIAGTGLEVGVATVIAAILFGAIRWRLNHTARVLLTLAACVTAGYGVAANMQFCF